MEADEYVNYELLDSVVDFVENPTLSNVFKNIYNNTLESIKFCEEQRTERTRIKEESKQIIEQLHIQRDFLMSYLDKTFDERKCQFDHFFKALDKAVEANNPQLMAMCLNSISTLALSSPFRPLIEAQKQYAELAAGKGKLDF